MARAASEWIDLFKKGSKGALKFASVGYYYKFSLSGFTAAYNYYISRK